MSVITPAMWQRMPWHAKAKAVAALDRERRALIDSLVIVKRNVDQYPSLRPWVLAATILHTLGTDPDAATHRPDLLESLGLCRDEDCRRRLDDKGRCSRHDWKRIRAERGAA